MQICWLYLGILNFLLIRVKPNVTWQRNASVTANIFQLSVQINIENLHSANPRGKTYTNNGGRGSYPNFDCQKAQQKLSKIIWGVM